MKVVRTYVRLDQYSYNTIKRGANKKGLAISSYMRMLLLERLEQMNEDVSKKNPESIR